MRRLSADNAYCLGLLLTYTIFMTPMILWGIPWIRHNIPSVDPLRVWMIGVSYAFSSVYFGVLLFKPAVVLLFKAAGLPFDFNQIKRQTRTARLIILFMTALILYYNPVRLYNADGTPRGMYAAKEGQVYFIDPGDCSFPNNCFSPVTGEKLIPIPKDKIPEILKSLEDENPISILKSLFTNVTHFN